MQRVFLQWRGLRLYAFPTLLYLGIVSGVTAGTSWASHNDSAAPRIYAALLLLLLPALLGARLLFVGVNWHLYRAEPMRIWRRSEGGAAMYGGLIVAFPLSLPILLLLRVNPLAFWDAASITALVAMVFARIGCLLNGCCVGRATKGPIALYLPDIHGVICRRFPTQLFEAGLAVLILLGGIGMHVASPHSGALFFYALGGYGLGRWLLEPTRERIDRIGRFSLNRVISVLLVGLAGMSLIYWALAYGRNGVSAK
jgi:phosphatidylglycerol---prolipoprotein diacylglyceryl transferase